MGVTSEKNKYKHVQHTPTKLLGPDLRKRILFWYYQSGNGGNDELGVSGPYRMFKVHSSHIECFT